jgi:hypothetical protein
MSNQSISFGDHVRVLSTEATQQLGVASLTGIVYGETMPYTMGIDVIGELTSDYAINVYFDNLQRSFWFAPELLELVDHAAGTEITLKGVSKKWTKTAAGQWQEKNIRDSESRKTSGKKPWWKFW